MTRFVWMLAVFSFLSPLAALSDTETVAETIVRPDDSEGSAPASDGVAECAAILAATSPTATNLIDRRNMRENSDAWFAAASQLAVAEGSDEISNDVRDTKVSTWSQRIGDVDGMRQQTAWMTYCADVAQTHGLDGAVFVSEPQ